MAVSLFNRLKKRGHREIALLQDEVVDIVYAVSNKAVLHGGTAIWRCYSGNRFSADLDFYLVKKKGFRQLFEKKLAGRGLLLSKFKQTENAVYAKVSNGLTEIRVEALLKRFPNPMVRQYEKADATFMDIFTLSKHALLLEKANAFVNRRLIRDVYDVFFLSRQLQVSKQQRKTLSRMVKKFPKPADEKNLEAIVFSGIVPSFEQMLQVLKARFAK